MADPGWWLVGEAMQPHLVLLVMWLVDVCVETHPLVLSSFTCPWFGSFTCCLSYILLLPRLLPRLLWHHQHG
jgi:hypothetical protein